MENHNNESPAILWSCICRDDVKLCEATVDSFDKVVNQTADEILAKDSTAGWEFHTKALTTKQKLLGHRRLQAAKFHVYAHECDYDWIVWVFACVYDPSHTTKSQVQAFLTKIVQDTEHERDNDIDWRYGAELACQCTYGDKLHYLIRNPSHVDKKEIIEMQILAAKRQMAKNIDLILERGEKLEDLQQDAQELNELAAVFKKSSKEVRRYALWQNAKYGLVMGTAITAAAAAAATPVLIAIL